MKIGISGSTCSGKTTFINYLRFNMDNLRTDVELINERATECPYPLNDQGGFRTQWWIQSNQILKEYELSKRFKTIITDRTVFDSIPYLMISKYSNEELRMIIQVAREWNNTYPYDYVFYFASIPIKPMNNHSALNFQENVDKNLRMILSLHIPHDHIIYVPVQEKIKRCEQTLETLLKLIK
jgi:hypothetical protein